MVFERGSLRHIDSLLVALICIALGVLFGALGIICGIMLLALSRIYQPPQRGIWYLFGEDVRRPLWIDRQRVVLRQPYRVIYRDEVDAAGFCRLRRLCMGLPG